MNPLDVQSDIREYDVLVGGGRPQMPDPTYGRHGNSFREGRTVRGRPTQVIDQSVEAEVLYYMVFDLETGAISVEHPPDECESP